MTVKDLERLDSLRDEVKDLLEALERLRNASAVPAVNNTPSGGGSGTGNPVERTVMDIVDKEREIYQKRLEMIEIIDRIPSETTRIIFRERYVYQTPWAKISDKLGYAEPKNAHRRMKRFIQYVKTAGI